MTEEMDAKDVDILELLRNDSRMSMGDIGEKLKTSKATVSRRIAKLEEEKVILKHSLEIEPSKLNVLKSFLSLQVFSVPQALEMLSKYEEVRYIYKSFGDHHLVCEIYTRSVEDLYEMIQSRILPQPCIRNIEVDVLVERIVINENADLKLYRSTKQPK